MPPPLPSKKSPAGWTLCFASGPYRGGEIPLFVGDQLTIGRDPRSDVPLEEDGVSRQHARVLVSAGRVEVKDLGSTNGTYVNGERTPGAVLSKGDRLTVARSTMVLVHDVGG